MKCPKCGYEMVLEKYQGVEIEVCNDHGVWLDAGELEAIEKKALRKQKYLDFHEKMAAKREGKIQGMIFGILSFLWD